MISLQYMALSLELQKNSFMLPIGQERFKWPVKQLVLIQAHTPVRALRAVPFQSLASEIILLIENNLSFGKVFCFLAWHRSSRINYCLPLVLGPWRYQSGGKAPAFKSNLYFFFIYKEEARFTPSFEAGLPVLGRAVGKSPGPEANGLFASGIIGFRFNSGDAAEVTSGRQGV